MGDTSRVRGKPVHFVPMINWGARHSRPYRCGANLPSDQASTSPSAVTCDDCLNLMGTTIEEPINLTEFLDTKGVGTPTPEVLLTGYSYTGHGMDPAAEMVRRSWVVDAAAGETNLSFADWKNAKGVGAPTPYRHTPPRMEDVNGLVDGVFLFHGTHSDLGGVMEVVPMTGGNVEFTISATADHNEGMVFSLSHLDRADLIRALLHDFHYSPERGGPND